MRRWWRGHAAQGDSRVVTVNVTLHAFAGPVGTRREPQALVALSQDVLDRVRQLEKLHEGGVLSDEDFNAKVVRVLAG